MLAQLPGCAARPACLATVRSNAAHLRRPGSVLILSTQTTTNHSLTGSVGETRLGLEGGQPLSGGAVHSRAPRRQLPDGHLGRAARGERADRGHRRLLDAAGAVEHGAEEWGAEEWGAEEWGAEEWGAEEWGAEEWGAESGVLGPPAAPPRARTRTPRRGRQSNTRPPAWRTSTALARRQRLLKSPPFHGRLDHDPTRRQHPRRLGSRATRRLRRAGRVPGSSTAATASR